MTGYVPYRTASFLAPFDNVRHLYAVMNDPCKHGQCLVINVTSIKPNKSHDMTCVLDVGDHPFISKASYMLYRRAETTRSGHISNMIDKAYYLSREDWDQHVFQRIVDGIRSSLDTPQRIINYADENGIK